MITMNNNNNSTDRFYETLDLENPFEFFVNSSPDQDPVEPW